MFEGQKLAPENCTVDYACVIPFIADYVIAFSNQRRYRREFVTKPLL